jgi:hypothetical protein
LFHQIKSQIKILLNKSELYNNNHSFLDKFEPKKEELNKIVCILKDKNAFYVKFIYIYIASSYLFSNIIFKKY